MSVAARRPRILVVDDQPANIHVLFQILSGQYELFMATGGSEALALYPSVQPDLLLLDVVMPGIDGLEVCRQLKRDPDSAATPVIFVTGGTGADEENSCWEAGASDFVNKPVNPLTLQHRVNAHLAIKRQADALRAMALADGLTGIANRRHFDAMLAAEWRRGCRAAAPLALLMLDVDFFKRYNDRYGHQAGDDCLRRVAGALRDGLRRCGDLVARYGGEQFVCLLPGTGAAHAYGVGVALEARVRALAIAHAGSDLAPHVTVSVGAAALQPGRDALHDGLVALADRALYGAKQAGRGRVFLAPGPADGAL